MTDEQIIDASESSEPPALLHGRPVVEHFGQTVVFADRDGYVTLLSALADDGYDMCVDLTAVDHLTHTGRLLPEGIVAERFEVVVNLLSLEHRTRVRVRVQIPESDPTLPSTFDLWPAVEAYEREVFDMFGIRFEDHPDLTRILMPEDWVGHPLRKDFAASRIPVQFSADMADPER